MTTQTNVPVMFSPLVECWVCGGSRLAPVHWGLFEFALYREQDPELSSYTGHTFQLNRCSDCGFGQPDQLPTLPNYFDRMYDQHWSKEWLEQEFDATYKDYIFDRVLSDLDRLVSRRNRSLLDIGAHVGRFMHLASRRGWAAEGVELNPRTAAVASRKTGLPVHCANAEALARSETRYGAVTMLDVLEHIPDPVHMLETAHQLLEPGGWAAIKVPCGPSQLVKETVRSKLRKGYTVSIADNLVHINHFSPRSLRRALERTGFSRIVMTVGAPELVSDSCISVGGWTANAVRLTVYHLGRLVPGGLRTPLALNLQAYAMRERS